MADRVLVGSIFSQSAKEFNDTCHMALVSVPFMDCDLRRRGQQTIPPRGKPALVRCGTPNPRSNHKMAGPRLRRDRTDRTDQGARRRRDQRKRPVRTRREESRRTGSTMRCAGVIVRRRRVSREPLWPGSGAWRSRAGWDRLGARRRGRRRAIRTPRRHRGRRVAGPRRASPDGRGT